MKLLLLVSAVTCILGTSQGKDCQDPLISRGQLTASSEYSANHAASQGVLNYQKNSGSWSARTNDLNQWLQIDLGKTMKVARVATQGRYSGYDQWVTKYKLQYSDDGVSFQYYKEQGQTTDKEFVGNINGNTVVYHDLNPAIRARYIRFRPTAWESHISMRAEIYGCQVGEHVECQTELLVSGGQLTASSEYSANHAASQGVLNNQKNSGSWSARTNDYNQWLQVDLGKTMKATRVATQGRYSGYNQWVTKYNLQYSDDGVSFQYYKEQGQTTDKEFVGNRDGNTVVYHDLNPPISARYIRFRPTAWESHISMRAEIYGCQFGISQVEGCGVSKDDLDKRVVNGQEATPHSWPWLISLRYNERHICGGTLIKPNWVVTAAHCVAHDENVGPYTVIVGVHDRTGTTQHQKSYKLKRIIKHEQYHRNHLRNDIALLQMETSIDPSLHVNVVCLPKAGTRVEPGKQCYITGWGRTKGGGQAAVTLQEALLPVADIHSCSGINGKLIAVDDKTMLCAGGEGKAGGCQGDSGGSFVCKEDGRYVLRGAVSWGHRNCRTDHYTVFARVSNYIGWISAKIEGGGSGNGGTGGGCLDKNPNCPLYASHCQANYVRRACPRTCRICQ